MAGMLIPRDLGSEDSFHSDWGWIPSLLKKVERPLIEVLQLGTAIEDNCLRSCPTA